MRIPRLWGTLATLADLDNMIRQKTDLSPGYIHLEFFVFQRIPQRLPDTRIWWLR